VAARIRFTYGTARPTLCVLSKYRSATLCYVTMPIFNFFQDQSRPYELIGKRLAATLLMLA
jgi:hypothetical protein